MKFAAGNAQNIGARPQQQDAFGFSDPGDPKFVAHAGFLGVVADGMGGLTHGSEASQFAVLAFLGAYKRKTVGESIPKALVRCLGEANLDVLRVAQNVPAGDEVGTTLVAAVLHDHVLYWISVGDSRVYLLRGSTLTQLTADHVYARDLNRQVAEGKISLNEALNHPERSSLTSYLGQVEPAHVDKNVRPLQVTDDDCVMLCSDGFYRALTEQELVTGLRSNPQTACDTLVAQALAKRRKQQDNLTIITLKRQTRTPIPKRLQVVLAAIAMLLIMASLGGGYWMGKHFAVATMPTSVPSPTPPKNQSTGGNTDKKALNSHPAPKSKSLEETTGGTAKKKDTGKSGGEPSTTPPTQPPTGEGTTHPGRQKPTQPPPARGQDTVSPQEKSGPSQSDSQGQQNKAEQIQTPGSVPAPPTSPTTPQPPSEDKKKDSPAPSPNDDQPKLPLAAPKDDHSPNPPQPPKTSFTAGHTQIER